MFSVRENAASLNAFRMNKSNVNRSQKNLEKLSSGYKINRSADDASGLGISEKMKAQISALDQAATNSEDGISFIQTADGYLNEVHNMLNRMVELAMKSANGILDGERDGGELYEKAIAGEPEPYMSVSGREYGKFEALAMVDRAALQLEWEQLGKEIDRISETANFNNIKLFDGSCNYPVGIGEYIIPQMPIGDFYLDDPTVFANHRYASIAIYGLTWYEAKARCEELGGYLATITSQEENDFILTYVTLGNSYWLGGTDEKIEGQWEWITGEPWCFSHWDTGEPNNLGGNENYLTFRAERYGYWNDLAWNNTQGGKISFICEWELFPRKIIPAMTTIAPCPLKLQIGETSRQADKLFIAIDKINSQTLSIGQPVNVRTQDNANEAILAVRSAINTVSKQRSLFGAIQNRLEYNINNLQTASENTSSANSRIRDVDVAKETGDFVKNNVLVSASQSMLAQANTITQSALQLLQ